MNMVGWIFLVFVGCLSSFVVGGVIGMDVERERRRKRYGGRLK